MAEYVLLGCVDNDEGRPNQEVLNYSFDISALERLKYIINDDEMTDKEKKIMIRDIGNLEYEMEEPSIYTNADIVRVVKPDLDGHIDVILDALNDYQKWFAESDDESDTDKKKAIEDAIEYVRGG